jgi:hypothetical protein
MRLSADYMISKSGKQTETKGKKSGFDCVTDKIKEKGSKYIGKR